MRHLLRLLRRVSSRIVLVLLLIVVYIAKRLPQKKTRSSRWVEYESYQVEAIERSAIIVFILYLMKFYYRIAGLKGKIKANKNRRVSDFRYEMF